MAPEFDINSYEAMETEVINALGDNTTEEAIKITSTGPVKVVLDEMQVDEDESSLLPNTLNIRPKLDKTNKSSEKTKADPEMLIEGNTKLNKLRKMQFKRDKKKKARNEKQAVNLADVLENVTLSSANKSDVYDFKEDFK
uniref:Guanine nucleotide-binding protein-like 3-like protein n=4 Tax=Pararge aegeria TaxID=116150 RepID=S4PV48_9NEOP